MKVQDEVRLRHMLDATRSALSFAENRTRADLDRDLEFAFAVVRAIEIIGEAARMVRTDRQATIHGIPWKGVTGMRHKVAHDGFDVDNDVVWRTVRVRLPEIKLAPQDALRERGESGP